MAPPSLPQPVGRHLGDETHPRSGVFDLPAVPAAVGLARTSVRRLLARWGTGDGTTDNAVLVISELVTNAVKHTGSVRIACRVRVDGHLLHIEVADENRAGTLPIRRRPGPEDQGGRGLLLVGMLSGDWGVRDAPHGSGRVVWAVLAVLGIVIKGLFWLVIVGAILFVATGVIGIVKRGALSARR